MTISLLILSAVLLSACGKQETAGSMKLTKAELSHKEKALADLLAPVGSSRLFDFTVDETIRQVTVTTYELKNGPMGPVHIQQHSPVRQPGAFVSRI